jgi:hypothetical protein
MTQASLLKPTRKTDAKYLRDQVLLAEQHEANAAGSAATATNKATEASEDQALTEAAKNQTAALKDATENLKNQAAAIVVSGDVSYDPQANQVPLARANGSIDPQWIKGALKPANWIEAGSATSGALIPDSTEYDFTAQMARFIPPIFIPEVMAEEIVIYDDAPLSICITTDKKIRVAHYGVYESEPLNVSNDWVEFAFGKADNETDTVTIYFIANGRQIGSTIVGDYSDLAVRGIFNEGAVAGFYGCASPAHQKQNSTATERIHNPGDPVGYDYDLGPNEVNASQGTSTARCLIGRQPLGGVRNLRDKSYLLEDPIWTRIRLNVPEVHYIPNPLNAPDVRKIVPNLQDGGHYIRRDAGIPGELMSYSVAAKAAEYSKIKIKIQNLTEGALYATFDLLAGTVVSADAGMDVTIVPLGMGFYNCQIVEDPKYNYTSTGEIYVINNDDEDSFLGDGSSGIYILNTQVELGDTPTNHQLRVNYIDVTEPGVQDVYFHQYGLDDVTPRTLPAITDGTIIIGGKKGIWIDTLTFAGGTFNLDDGGYTGAPAGLYDLIGDLVGWFVADATLSTPEETAVVNWLKQKGCPGDVGASAELLPNPGDPFTTTDNWGSVNSATLSVESGQLKIQNSGNSIGGAREVLTVEVGEFYLFEATGHSLGTSNGRYLKLGSTASGSEYYNGGNSNSYRRIIKATTTDLSILFQPNNNVSDAYNTVGGVSVKKLTINTGA